MRLVLRDEFGIEAIQVDRVHGGTATDNFVAETPARVRWFVKVYRPGADLQEATAAIELTDFAARGGIPVAAVRRTLGGEVVAHGYGLVVSVWNHVDGETAERGLTGERWRSVGTIVGRLHHHLAGHPLGRPAVRSPAALFDLPAALVRHDRLIAEYRRRDRPDPFEAWAADALVEKRDLLPTVYRMLERLPPLTVQILHGDLTAPNVLLRGDDVAALIDFLPPSPGFLAWEVARIACDPRTLTMNARWLEELPEFLDAYRRADPGVSPADVESVLTVGAAYTVASTYPLAAPIDRPGSMNESLRDYGRRRHAAALAMLEAAAGL